MFSIGAPPNITMARFLCILETLAFSLFLYSDITIIFLRRLMHTYQYFIANPNAYLKGCCCGITV